MTPKFGLIAVACAAPGLALAQVADGTYEIGQCNTELSDARVTVAGERLAFHEASLRADQRDERARYGRGDPL